MPAYAKDGKVVCFFQGAAKFDEGTMWATAFALTKLKKAEERRVAELVKQAVS